MLNMFEQKHRRAVVRDLKTMPIRAHDDPLDPVDPTATCTDGQGIKGSADNINTPARVNTDHAVHRTATEALRKILGETKRAIVGSLIDHANHAASNAELQQLTTDLFALNRWAERFEDELLRSIFSAPLACATGQPTYGGNPNNADGLALLDKDTFERALETKKFASQLAERFKPELKELGDLLADRGPAMTTPAVEEIPLTPDRIAQSMSQLADAMDMGLASRRVAFECARTIFAKELGGVYQSILGELRGQGLVPRSDRPRSQRQRSCEEPAAATTLQYASEGRVHATPCQTHDTAQKPSARVLRCAPSAAAELALGGLWTKLQPAADLTASDIIEGLDHAAKEQGFEEGLGRNARQRTELASRLWDLVRNDSNLSSSAESWRHRLQLPLLAAATTDPEFFGRHDHPVRIILDRLEELGNLINATEDAGLARSIRDTVEHVLTQIGGPTVLDEQLLKGLANSIEELAEGQTQPYRRNVERVTKACAGRDQLRRCRDRVRLQLAERYDGKQVPTVLPELLDAGWRTLLEITLLRQGDAEPQYLAYWETLDAMVRRLGGQPYCVTDQPREADKILDELAAGLEFTTGDPLTRTSVLEKLRRLLAQAGSGSRDLVTYDASIVPSQPIHTPPDGVPETEWRSAFDRIDGMRVGDALVLDSAKAGRTRLRLAWVGEGGWIYTFVDQRGFKAADLTPDQLAKRLISHQVHLEPLEKRPLTERAIDQVLDSLREQVDRQRATDAQTGLNNPSRFQTLLAHTLTDARQGVPHVLCWIDLDQFTVLRNTFGLEAADRLRVAVSRLLKQHFGGKGILAHLGGDQFAATLTRCGKDRGLELADEFRQAVKDLSFSWEGTSVPVAASVGLIDLTEVNASCADVLQAADATMFAAKRDGGNRCVLYTGSDGVIHRRKSSMEWITKVDQALDRGRLDLRCQRIAPVDPSSGLGLHYEVLLGVKNEEGDLLDIDQFITAAESYNRMWAVDRWVARGAFEWAAKNPEELERLGGLAINLSGQSMNDEGIVDFLQSLFRETGVAPERISFEATETVAITNLNRASHIIRAIKSMGCSFALDDFGSGFSSYSYLKQLPVDWLKIDGAFVRGIHGDQSDYGVVKSIHEIGHFMGKHTIAEYVENQDILDRLREIGVDYAQGYGIEVPRRLAELS